jgi:hypothetical protein
MPRRVYFLDVPRKTKCLLCSLWHYTTFRHIHFPAAEFNAVLCMGFLKPPQSDVLCLSLCLCHRLFVCVPLHSPPPRPQRVTFRPDFQKLLKYVVWASDDIFCAGFFFFEPVTRNVGNEPLESSQTSHKDRINLLAFWIPNSTKESPSLEAYHLSRSEENYPLVMGPEILIICD